MVATPTRAIALRDRRESRVSVFAFNVGADQRSPESAPGRLVLVQFAFDFMPRSLRSSGRALPNLERRRFSLDRNHSELERDFRMSRLRSAGASHSGVIGRSDDDLHARDSGIGRDLRSFTVDQITDASSHRAVRIGRVSKIYG